MNKWPLPNSVLVINNASIHRVDGIREMVQEHGARLVYLPAYSPDFNPIELAFSSIKAWLRVVLCWPWPEARSQAKPSQNQAKPSQAKMLA